MADDDELKALHQSIKETILEHGQQCLGVFNDPDEEGSLPFMYTIGNYLKGLPELLLVGSADPAIQQLLNVLHKMVLERGSAFNHGELVNVGGHYPLKIVDASNAAKDYTVQVGVHFGTDDYRVQQVIICDPVGRWPDDPECIEPYKSMPYLGITH